MCFHMKMNGVFKFFSTKLPSNDPQMTLKWNLIDENGRSQKTVHNENAKAAWEICKCKCTSLFLANAYHGNVFIVGSMWMKNVQLLSLTYSGSISVESLYWKFLCLLCLGKQFGKKEKQIENFLIRRLILCREGTPFWLF